MISLPEFKKSLGSLAEDMSDAEIEELRNKQDQLANVFFECWLRKKNSAVNNQVGNK